MFYDSAFEVLSLILCWSSDGKRRTLRNQNREENCYFWRHRDRPRPGNKHINKTLYLLTLNIGTEEKVKSRSFINEMLINVGIPIPLGQP